MTTHPDLAAPRVVELPYGWIAYLDGRKLASFAQSRNSAVVHVLASAEILDSLIARAYAASINRAH